MLSPDLIARFAHNQALVSGRLHVLNLDLLERHFGDHWPRVRERALALAEQTIQAGLGPQDLQLRVDDATWLFFFPSLDKASAQVRCAMLADRVFRRLIGDDNRLEDIRIETVVVEADGRTLLEAADPLALIQAMLNGMEPARDQDDAGMAEDDDQPTASAPGGKPAHQLWVKQERERFPSDIEFHYMPTWDAGRSVVATHVCEARREAPGGVRLTGYDTLTTGHDSPLVGELDLATFREAHRSLRRLLRDQDPGIVSFPVHCRSLELAGARQRLSDAMERTRPEERRLFAALLSGLPIGAPAHRVAHGVSFLRRYARTVFVRWSLRHPHFDALNGSGAYGVTCNLTGVNAFGDDLRRLLRAFHQHATKAGLKTVVAGISGADDLAAALEAGIVTLQGPAIMPPVRQALGLRRFVPVTAAPLVLRTETEHAAAG